MRLLLLFLAFFLPAFANAQSNDLQLRLNVEPIAEAARSLERLNDGEGVLRNGLQIAGAASDVSGETGEISRAEIQAALMAGGKAAGFKSFGAAFIFGGALGIVTDIVSYVALDDFSGKIALVTGGISLAMLVVGGVLYYVGDMYSEEAYSTVNPDWKAEAARLEREKALEREKTKPKKREYDF